MLPRFLGLTGTGGLQKGRIGSRSVLVVFLAHPAGFQAPKKLSTALTDSELAEAREAFLS